MPSPILPFRCTSNSRAKQFWTHLIHWQPSAPSENRHLGSRCQEIFIFCHLPEHNKWWKLELQQYIYIYINIYIYIYTLYTGLFLWEQKLGMIRWCSTGTNREQIRWGMFLRKQWKTAEQHQSSFKNRNIETSKNNKTIQNIIILILYIYINTAI